MPELKERRGLVSLLTERNNINEPRHVISNNVVFLQVKTQTTICSLLLSLETQMMFGQKLNSHIIFERQVKALIRLRVCAG